MRRLTLIPLLFAVAGCAHYEYDLVQPPDLRHHISTKADTIVLLDPLEYRLLTVDNRLVIRSFNPTDDPILLLGDKSVIVDPHGQSHPLRSQTIAPHSFAKLILPPIRPTYYDPGPTFGFGVGTTVGTVHHHHAFYPGCDPVFDRPYYWYDQPRYFYFYDEGDTHYWEWDGPNDVRVTLVYQRGDKQIKHEMTFRRVKI